MLARRGKQMETAVILVLFGALMSAINAVFLKKALRGLPVSLVGVIRYIPSAVFLFLLWMIFENPSDHPAIYWYSVMGTTVFNIAIQWCNLRSMQLGDVSIVNPIQSWTPGLITIAGWLLGEKPTMLGVVGIVLMATGAYIVTSTAIPEIVGWKDYFRLLGRYALFSKLEPRVKKAIQLAYISACLGTFGIIFDGGIARNGAVGLGFGVVNLVVGIFFSILLMRNRDEDKPEGKKEDVSRIMLYTIGAITAAHWFSTNFAYRYALIPYVGTLKRAHILLTVILAGTLLKEERMKERLLGASVMTAGIVLISLAESNGTRP